MRIKIKDIVQMASALIAITDHECTTFGEDEAVELAEKIIHESTNKYEEGWHDAIDMVLKERVIIHTEKGIVRCVQEDALMGIALSHQQSKVNLEREVEI